MKIYSQEIKDGLELSIKSNSSIAFDFLDTDKPKYRIKAGKQNENQPDLFYIESILVSTVWNANDDVFLKEEVWNARSSPVDKQFNLMHDPKKNIGHITYSKVLDTEGNEIPDNTALSDVPDNFDVLVGSVIYKHINTELEEEASKIIEGIQNGEWYVSMECLFSDFDYAITKGSEQYIIERNEDTSFLTKYLRYYGGQGTYQDSKGEYKIGRIPKNLFFSGKGLVDNPANKRSVIVSYGFSGAKASLNQVFSENKMEVSLEQYNELKQELATAKDMAKAASQKEVADLKSELTIAKASADSLSKESDSLKSISAEKTEKIASLEASVASKDQEIQTLKAKNLELETTIKSQARISDLVSVGVESAKAAELVKKFSSASDEMFGEVVDLHKTKAKCDEDMKKEDKKEEKKEDAKAGQVDLDKLEASSASVLNQDTESKDDGLHVAKAKEFFSEVLKANKKKN